MKYQIILKFKDGRTIESIVLDRKPTDDEAKGGMMFYHADDYEIIQVR